jgi:hypothetical protein
MIYLAKVTLGIPTEKITSEIIITEKSLIDYKLSSYQMSRALSRAGIDKKTKTKYEKWKDAKLLKIDIIKEIKGIS